MNANVVPVRLVAIGDVLANVGEVIDVRNEGAFRVFKVRVPGWSIVTGTTTNNVVDLVKHLADDVWVVTP